jgi:hypothetical protein
LWRVPNPWRSWKNAFQTALAYEKTLRLSAAAQMDYWTYQDNYPLNDGEDAFPVWHIIRQMEEVFRPAWRVAVASSTHEDLKALPTIGATARECGVLLINSAGAGKATLTGLPPNATLHIEQSTQNAQRKKSTARTDAAGHVVVELPSQCVVTIVSTQKQ